MSLGALEIDEGRVELSTTRDFGRHRPHVVYASLYISKSTRKKVNSPKTISLNVTGYLTRHSIFSFVIKLLSVVRRFVRETGPPTLDTPPGSNTF
jgi:hypothetical protein